MRHCLINGDERVANGDWGSLPKVKAAQDTGPTITGTKVREREKKKKLCLKAQPDFRGLNRKGREICHDAGLP